MPVKVMSKDNPVPKLDLAPKLKRPLSLWNPLDYLRLLYWVFYFPQALRWYVDEFGGGDDLAKQATWQEKLAYLRQHPVQLKLSIQGLILILIVPFILSQLIQLFGVDINWLGVAFGVAGGVAFGVAGGVVDGMAGGVAFGVAEGVAGGVALGVAVCVAVIVA